VNKPLDEFTYVVIDVETTGVTRFDRICEIGMTKIDRGEIVDKFETLLNPGISITNTIFHGIETRMVKDAPPFRDIAGKIVEYIGDSVLIAHNAPFDMRFMRYELQRLNTDLAHLALCTLKIARRLHPEFTTHRLDYMLYHYDIVNECPHRAGADADSEARLFLDMKRKMGSCGLETLNSLGRWGLPYNHKWCDKIHIDRASNGVELLTRDDLV
jgi:DNA polymerase III epsilon subunit family exonuclease